MQKLFNGFEITFLTKIQLLLNMDITQALRDAENSLRDFAASILSKNGEGWVDRCGVSPERIAKWKERKAAEEKRQETGVVEERLIYYADFYDLKTILKKNWAGELSEALGDWKTFEVFLDALEKLRDTDAHRRELLPHQKHLVLGVSGEIRNRIIRYRSKMETPDDCFPRIESARDSLGNLWVPGSDIQSSLKTIHTNTILRPGDILDFIVTANDPEDLPLEYAVSRSSDGTRLWQSDPNLHFCINESHISRTFLLEVSIKSTRAYHASSWCDDYVSFIYRVLPRNTRR